MPGGLGAQLGLPWFGTGLIGALLFVEVVVELFVLLVLVLLLLLVSRLLTEPPFPNSDDLFGATDRFKPFVGGGGGVAGTLAIELLELIERNRLCYVCAYKIYTFFELFQDDASPKPGFVIKHTYCFVISAAAV